MRAITSGGGAIMGANDAAEMLEAAKAEVVRLEHENAELRRRIGIVDSAIGVAPREESGPGMMALGDQVQHSCVMSGMNLIGFVILAADGRAEYRSPYPIDMFRTKILEAAAIL